MLPPDPIAQSRDRAVRALIRLQEQDGHWQDYALPIGASDAWVTGYAGFALAEAGAWPAAEAAAAWLRAHRYAGGGWGYNGITGPDADSTAWALRLFITLGMPADQADLAFLRSRQRADGGFSTYDAPGWWGRSQADVTAAVLLALPAADLASVATTSLGYLEQARLADGSWPSYWWRTGHYATALCIEALARLGRLDSRARPVVTEEDAQAIHTAFDLACIAHALSLVAGGHQVTGRIMQDLVAMQADDGRWSGGANLRVTDPGCAAPWREPRGTLYVDERGVITTATALRALSRTLANVVRSPRAGILKGAGR